MENKIYYVSSQEMVGIKETIQQDSALFIAEIKSSDVQTLQDYLRTISEVFRFPFPSRGLDGYYDWMRDLDWLSYDGFVLIIYDYKNFLSQDLLSKTSIIDGFSNIVLPFWQEEVSEVVVEGHVKPFMLYLVD